MSGEHRQLVELYNPAPHTDINPRGGRVKPPDKAGRLKHGGRGNLPFNCPAFLEVWALVKDSTTTKNKVRGWVFELDWLSGYTVTIRVDEATQGGKRLRIWVKHQEPKSRKPSTYRLIFNSEEEEQ